MIKNFIFCLIAATLAGCQHAGPSARLFGVETIAHLPEPVTNNAAARIGDTLYSFAGLHAGKTWRDVTANAYACALDTGMCRTIAPLPDGAGRLAAAAVALKGRIYIFGGYSVAKDGTEKSTPQVWIFDPESETYSRAEDIPLPVDDSVALAFQDRYIYLVSGWHDKDNVAAVQVLDTKKNRWFSATPFPGAPVFGHAGAINADRLLICGGVKVVPPVAPQKKRRFVLSNACYQGEIKNGDPELIDWAPVKAPQSGAGYRMAASSCGRAFCFFGGTMNPYNYNGIGYDGVPSAALALLRTYIPARPTGSWTTHNLGRAAVGMDYRSMVLWRNHLVIAGGMGKEQNVVDTVRAIAFLSH